MSDSVKVLCCGCCAACAGLGLATAIFVAYILYYILTAVFGCVIIYYGVALRQVLGTYSSFIESSDDIYLYSSLCIAVGTMFTVVVILGLCAQRTNMSKLMVVGSIIQLAVLVVGIYTYCWAYPGNEEVEKYLNDGFNKALDNYNIETNKMVAEWDDLQLNLECCGKLNYITWKDIVTVGGFPPSSCCRKYAYMDTCSYDVHYENAGRSAITVNVQGCMPKVENEIIGQMKTLQRILIPFLIVTLIGFFSSICNTGANESSKTEGKMVAGLYVNVPKSKVEADAADKEAGPEEAPDNEEGPIETKTDLAIEMEPVESTKKIDA